MNDRARTPTVPARGTRTDPAPRRPKAPAAPSARGQISGPPTRPAPRIPAAVARSAPLAALWTGFAAAAVGCFIAVIAALLAWIPDAGATGTSTSTVRAGIITFLTAQHGGVRLNGVPMHFVPLGLTAIAVWVCWRAGRVLYSVPVVRTDRRSARILILLAWQLGGYVLTCSALIPFARVGTSSVPAVGAITGAVLVGCVGLGASTLRYTPLGRRVANRLPVSVRAGLRGAAGATAGFLAGGALLVMAATMMHAGRFVDLSRALGRGAAGLPIAVLDLLTAPNAVLAGSAYLSGAGFAVGSHATYAPFGGRAGLVPAFPVISGLPGGSRASGVAVALLVLTVLGAGLAAGLLVQRATRYEGWTATLVGTLVAGAGGGVILAALVGLGGGSLGRHNLSAVGASPWQVGLLAAAEIGAVALPVAVTARAVASFRHRDVQMDETSADPGRSAVVPDRIRSVPAEPKVPASTSTPTSEPASVSSGPDEERPTPPDEAAEREAS